MVSQMLELTDTGCKIRTLMSYNIREKMGAMAEGFQKRQGNFKK